MKKFRVLIREENFFFESEGATKRFGFYTTRYVKADDEQQAERFSVDALRQEDHLRTAVRNDRSDPPMLFAEEIVEIASFDSIEHMAPGLVFYEDQGVKH